MPSHKLVDDAANVATAMHDVSHIVLCGRERCLTTHECLLYRVIHNNITSFKDDKLVSEYGLVIE